MVYARYPTSRVLYKVAPLHSPGIYLVRNKAMLMKMFSVMPIRAYVVLALFLIHDMITDMSYSTAEVIAKLGYI